LASERNLGQFKVGIGREIDASNLSQYKDHFQVAKLEDDSSSQANGSIGFRDVIYSSLGELIFVGYSDWHKSSKANDINFFRVQSLAKEFVDASLEMGGIDDDIGMDMIEDDAENFIVVGSTIDVDGVKKAYVGKGRIFGLATSPVWEFLLTTSGVSSEAYKVSKVSDGYVVVGICNDGSQYRDQLNIFKIDLNGTTLIWQKKYGYTSLDEARSVVETTDGKLAVFGTSRGERGNPTMCFMKLDRNGNLN
jgi:hypothetical protein